jgi:hypothetical protein
MRRLATAFFITALIFSASAHAEGNRFATRQRGSWQDFGYQWIDSSGKTRTLNVSLAAADIALGDSEFNPWDDSAVNQQANRQVAIRANQLSSPQVAYRVQPRSNGFSIITTGTRQALSTTNPNQIQQTLHQTYLQSIQQYASQHYYTAEENGNELIIQPDHVRLAQRYTPAMAPVGKALRDQVAGQGADVRTYINATLNWLQTIPYDTLLNRSTSNGAGFQTPYGLMVENRGDCDTKTTALAAILRSQFPGLPLAIVYIPKHAFLAIGVPQGAHDFALQTVNGTYVLADPTGPALASLGDIDDQTQAELRAQNTKVVPIP